MRAVLWGAFFAVARAILVALLPIRAIGREHVPARGPYVVVANHAAWVDPPALALALGVPLRFMAKRELFAIPLLGLALRFAGAFPVRRGEADRRALLTALRVLEAGHPLGFFPEGHRSPDGRLRRARAGIAFLVLRSGAPVVPAAIVGTGPGPRGGISVRVGTPFRMDELAATGTEDPQALADRIMLRVAALLPEELRGHYAATPAPGER
jgi:1-acyl-sn-glycerol-3-phosphate acyltransferase